MYICAKFDVRTCEQANMVCLLSRWRLTLNGFRYIIVFSMRSIGLNLNTAHDEISFYFLHFANRLSLALPNHNKYKRHCLRKNINCMLKWKICWHRMQKAFVVMFTSSEWNQNDHFQMHSNAPSGSFMLMKYV